MTAKTPITDDQWRHAFAHGSSLSAVGAMVGRGKNATLKAGRRLGLKPSSKPQPPTKPQPVPRAVIPKRDPISAADRVAIADATPPVWQRVAVPVAARSCVSPCEGKVAHVTLWAPFEGSAW